MRGITCLEGLCRPGYWAVFSLLQGAPEDDDLAAPIHFTLLHAEGGGPCLDGCNARRGVIGRCLWDLAWLIAFG